MRLSRLQKYILTAVYLRRPQPLAPKDFYAFYSAPELKAGAKVIHDTVHSSLDNLVAKDLLVAVGRKTAQKWYIDKVKLTASGRKLARGFIKDKQLKLVI